MEERHLPILLYAILILVVFFFHKEVKVLLKDLMFIYMPFADLSFKVSITLYNLLRETKRFISRKEE